MESDRRDVETQELSSAPVSIKNDEPDRFIKEMHHSSATTSQGGLYIPPHVLPDSSGFQRIPLDLIPRLCWCEKGQICMFCPGGVHWNLAYSSGVCGFRPDFFRRASPADSADNKRLQTTPLEYTQIQLEPTE